MAQALRKSKGNVAAAAHAFGVTRQAVHDYINHHADELKPIVAEGQEVRLDRAECALDNAVGRGAAWAICFTLKTKGKDRGYIETQKLQHGGDPENPLPAPEVKATVVVTPEQRVLRLNQMIQLARQREMIDAATIETHPEAVDAERNGKH